jgi:glycopeptide antibiotics resistance protein
VTPYSLDQLLRDMPFLVPALGVVAGVAAILARRVGAGLGVGRRAAFLLMASIGLVLAVTLTPATNNYALAGHCDLTALAPLTPGQLLRVTDRSLNVWLFVPLGIAFGGLPGSRSKAALIGLAAVLPFGIEAIQYAATDLGRECEGRDVVDNLVGLGMGLLATAIIGVGGRLHAPPA